MWVQNIAGKQTQGEETVFLPIQTDNTQPQLHIRVVWGTWKRNITRSVPTQITCIRIPESGARCQSPALQPDSPRTPIKTLLRTLRELHSVGRSWDCTIVIQLAAPHIHRLGALQWGSWRGASSRCSLAELLIKRVSIQGRCGAPKMSTRQLTKRVFLGRG